MWNINILYILMFYRYYKKDECVVDEKIRLEAATTQ